MGNKYEMFKIFDNFFTESECDNAVEYVINRKSDWYVCPWTSMRILGNSLFRKVTFTDTGINHGDYFEVGPISSPASILLKDKLSSMFNKVKTIPDRKSTRLNSSHIPLSRMPSSA